MMPSIKKIPNGTFLKLKCSLAYSQMMQTLFLVLDSDVIPMAVIVIE